MSDAAPEVAERLLKFASLDGVLSRNRAQRSLFSRVLTPVRPS